MLLKIIMNALRIFYFTIKSKHYKFIHLLLIYIIFFFFFKLGLKKIKYKIKISIKNAYYVYDLIILKSYLNFQIFKNIQPF